jgi:hypothetical protein
MSQQSISIYGDNAEYVYKIIKPSLRSSAQLHNINKDTQDLHLFRTNIVLLCFNNLDSFKFISKQFDIIKGKAPEATFILIEESLNGTLLDSPAISTFKKTHNIQCHLSFSQNSPLELPSKIIEALPELENFQSRKSFEDYSYTLKAMLLHSTATGFSLLAAGLAVKFILASTPVFMTLFAASAVCGAVSLGITATFFKHHIDQKRKDAKLVTPVTV